MLHLIKSSPFTSNSLALCLTYANDEDSILLFEDAVIAGVNEQIWQKKLQQRKIEVYLLEEDVIARSFLSKISPKFNLIDINGWVELTEKHQTIINW